MNKDYIPSIKTVNSVNICCKNIEMAKDINIAQQIYAYNGDKSNWYDRVYLCYQDTNSKNQNTYAAIKGFNCYRYDSFENADYSWRITKQELHKLELRHTMIPVCKWIPEILDKYILGWKLKKMYWGGQIYIYNKKQ